jgi:hypothetical protein
MYADGKAWSEAAVSDQAVDPAKKFYARALKTCPDWHIGHGGKSWIFVDELIADKR